MPESFRPKTEQTEPVQLSIELAFEDLVPATFRADPFLYFQEEGRNVKQGDIQYKDDGTIREDPTAVKDLPNWKSSSGEIIGVVGKRVNIQKSQIAKTGDPFYEYRVMQYVRSLGLPAPAPIATASQGNNHLIIMERIPGFRVINDIGQQLKELRYTDNDLHRLKQEAERLMREIEERFTREGIERTWKLSDMVVDIDPLTKTIRSMTPTDWERTKIRTSRK
ncbi:hypothetical protein KBD13_00590 [Patescibacteria group bacterium]|nr:hypothetical protein [Patescibacteria group bacterium]